MVNCLFQARLNARTALNATVDSGWLGLPVLDLLSNKKIDILTANQFCGRIDLEL
jgi:hypothetical protein